MLSHSNIKRCIIILSPSTEWVQQENWVLVSEFQELLSGVLEEENVTVVEWVSNLESVNGISISFLDLLVDFHGSISVLVHSVVEFDFLDESHLGS